jgi:hypothetical protein
MQKQSLISAISVRWFYSSFWCVRGWGALSLSAPAIFKWKWSRWWPLWEDLSLTFWTEAEHRQFETPMHFSSPSISLCYFCTCRYFNLQTEFCVIILQVTRRSLATSFRLCLDVFGFASIHMCWGGLEWNWTNFHPNSPQHMWIVMNLTASEQGLRCSVIRDGNGSARTWR